MFFIRIIVWPYKNKEWGPSLHTFFLFLHVFFIFLFIFSAFPLFFIPILTRAAAHQHQCLRSAGRVTRVSVRARTRACVCVSCKSSAFHVFIFHHCKWSVLDSAGCNYELLSIFRHTQLHFGESLGDVIISVMAQRCHPPSPRTPCIHYNYYLLKISPLLSAGWCSTWQSSADMLLTYMGRRVLIRFLFLHVMAALRENTDLSH